VITIDVKKELGSDVVTREHGRRLRELIVGAWKDELVTVDFGGLQITSVSFFDEAFGQLALMCGAKEVDRRLRLINLDKFDQALLADILASRSREVGRRSRSRAEPAKVQH
jgi:hypothetical protein